jgi:dipeptidyl aminopeptidase/acylaminoacyl peptidase
MISVLQYGFVLLSVLAVAGFAQGESKLSSIPLIPRDVLFGNPEKAAARISPDGARLAYLAPVDGVLNVWVGPIDNPDAAKPVTREKKRGIRRYSWAYTSDHIIYLQDAEGDENWRVNSVNVETDEIRDLTPMEGVRAQIQEVSYKFPKEILVGLNDRDPQYHDIYRINIITGEKSLVIKNEGFAGFVTDEDYQVRFGSRMTPTGGKELFRRVNGDWEQYISIDRNDTMTTYIIGFTKDGQSIYMLDSRERNTAALTKVELDTAEQTVIAKDPRADIAGLMMHPTEHTVQAANFNYLRREWQYFDEQAEKDIKLLQSIADADVHVVSRTLDDREWLAALVKDQGPAAYYHLNRDTGEYRFLFVDRSQLKGQPLVEMHPVVIEARDGQKLVSYLTLPPHVDGDVRPGEPLPMVLNVHGGPWHRDQWGYDPVAQWLANRGYVVLQVNFRGSTGFGKDFVNLADKQWAGTMHDDLIDAVNWAIEEKIADPDKVAIFGGSYGGYATLVGLTFTPKKFACGVDIVGPSSLITLIESIPPYWKPMMEMFTTRVGDPTTKEGREFLKARSPLTYVERIERPLLIGQGANDPRVKQAESDQIVEAMKEKKIPVTYVLYPDEGHGFARPENRTAFNAVMEAFLAEHLGGRVQPIGDDFEGSSITVPTGAGQVDGLQEALNGFQAKESG